MTEFYLIEKRGLYYRPNAQGYTGLKSEAGRYSREDAEGYAFPNGPDGPTDGIRMIREDDAPAFSKSCPWDVRVKTEAFSAGRKAGLREAARAIDNACVLLTGTNDDAVRIGGIFRDAILKLIEKGEG